MAVPAHVPELATLDVLVAVAVAGSMSAAGRALNMSQQAVSARVHSAEREIGIAVFRRSPAGVEPTAEGVLILEWAGAVIERAERLSAGVDSLLGHRNAELTVAASMTIAEYLVPEWVVALRRASPDVKIRVRPMNSTDVAARVVDGSCDVGFVEGSGAMASLQERTVATDELILVVPQSHPWAQRASVTAAELARTALVQREPGSGTRVVFTESLAAAGYEPAEPMLELTSVSAVRAAMLSSDSPAVLSSMSVADDLRRGTLVAVAIDGITMPRRLRAVWDRDRGLRGPARDLVDIAIRHAAPGSV
ncbi:LysR family transcriptional regulator [Williamsia phyllosphaerae]|uniref:LysR family transcriptional regulator n=1 Tax=Williamsia phyllosphaerae TaxID=885042 RepID=A0ABQ1UIT5_9NOCA|nr:LysR family transcriptional regulator [Williamsia phyllosphaerae]GGF19142.1 LysR family transcriptional regulator [Williamsia phyllosphaerae]